MPGTALTAQEVAAVPVTNHQCMSPVGHRQLITACIEDCLRGEKKKIQRLLMWKLNVLPYETLLFFSCHGYSMQFLYIHCQSENIHLQNVHLELVSVCASVTCQCSVISVSAAVWTPCSVFTGDWGLNSISHCETRDKWAIESLALSGHQLCDVAGSLAVTLEPIWSWTIGAISYHTECHDLAWCGLIIVDVEHAEAL